jgi:hypothetical protein
MLTEKNKGKIIIRIENENGKINSNMEFIGIAKKAEIAITTLLVNFVSLSLEKGKDPKEVLDNHFEAILKMLIAGKKIDDK